jgi:hypothetical protein
MPPYQKTFWDEGDKKGWTEKQKKAAFAYADRIFWAREVSEGSGQYVIVYSKIPVTLIRAQIETVLSDLNQALDPKNAEMKQYLDTFGLRKDLLHEEEVAEAAYTRIRAAELEDQFKKKMGEAPEYGMEAEAAAGYNIRKIFLAKDLSEAFPFKSDVVEAAKKNGTLKPIEDYTIAGTSVYDHKAPDPSHPEDKNEFIWRERKMGVRLVNYKIIDVAKPDNNRGNYIEGTRVIDGVPESKPSLKIFFPGESGPGNQAIVLICTSREGKDAGFGVPDILETFYSIHDVGDIIANGRILQKLFVEKEKTKRVMPETKLFKIEISPIGGPADEWQKSPDATGWVVPFKYAIGPRFENYNVRIKFRKPKYDPNMTPEQAHANMEYMQIEYIEKEYTKVDERYAAAPGRVTEYYRPRGVYAGKVRAWVQYNEDTKKVGFRFPDGTLEDGYVAPGDNKFIEAEPYAKSYNEGQKRWWIEKSAGSDVYDKRKLVGQPKENTGDYGNAPDVDTATDVQHDQSDERRQVHAAEAEARKGEPRDNRAGPQQGRPSLPQAGVGGVSGGGGEGTQPPPLSPVIQILQYLRDNGPVRETRVPCLPLYPSRAQGGEGKVPPRGHPDQN